MPKISGRDETKWGFAPPPPAWKWDVPAGGFKTRGNGGEQGSCQGTFPAESTEDGIKFQVYLGHYWKNLQKHGGYIKCIVSGPAFRMVDTTAAIAVQSGTIDWLSDVALTLPADVESFQLKVTTFDRRTLLYGNTGVDKFFTVDKQGDRLILHPVAPADIGQ